MCVAGVKQTTVRARTTKHDAGTLPSAISFQPRHDLAQTSKPFNPDSAPDIAMDRPAVLQPDQNEAAIAEVVYRAGDFVAVDPSKKAQRLHANSGVIWYGFLKADVVYITRKEPKKAGSSKYRVCRKPQSAHLKLRWLEKVDGDDGPGCLYQWNDLDFIGDGEVEEQCLTGSVICRVDACAEISVEDQFTRYRVSQEEASRVGDKAMEESSSSDDSSSSGVDSDLQIDTVHVVVTLTLWFTVHLSAQSHDPP